MDSYDNTKMILSHLNNLKNDISFINSLKDTLVNAKMMGVQVGDSEQKLDEQVSDLQSKIVKIETDIDESLQKLIVLEESIKKNDTKLVFHDTVTNTTISNSDKFVMIENRLMSDKHHLDTILHQINDWNMNNSISIDDTSVISLKRNIDTSLDNFNDEVKLIAEEAHNYSQIITTEHAPIVSIVDTTSTTDHATSTVDVGTLTAHDATSNVHDATSTAHDATLITPDATSTTHDATSTAHDGVN